MVVDDLRMLLWAANLASLELHARLAKVRDTTRPTHLVFGLAPGPGTNILDCCRVARHVRDVLGSVGLDAFAQTSGSKGLQLYVLRNRSDDDFDRTKPDAHAVARLPGREHPDLVVSRKTRTLRTGKVLADWSRNDRHTSTTCAYSLRAVTDAAASTPITRGEVERALEADHPDSLSFDAGEVLRRRGHHGDLFAPVLDQRQRLPLHR